ncbi:MAG: hypothetical protein DRG78_23585 [Epsilonproteobacteria bacterium]|nr:MAG: hypothetical protein DRG78_23585 [Campylobacterota bacterium]
MIGNIKVFKKYWRNFNMKDENKNKLEQKITDLQTKLSTIIIEKETSEKRNKELSKQINELLNMQKDIEKQLNRAKKDSTLTDIKIEPNIYLKGMFDSFDKDYNALKIFIEGNTYYYPLEDYQCKYLPLSGSRVLIFHGDDKKYQIYGLDIAKIIEKAPIIEAIFKSVIPSTNQIKLRTKEYGYINVSVSNDFLKDLKITLSEQIMLKQIYIDGDYYFCLQEYKNNTYDINKILKEIKG